jgi:hypothetical protein
MISQYVLQGWFSGQSWADYWHLDWFNEFCPATWWAEGSAESAERGLSNIRISTLDHRLDRIERYLTDVEMKGFFNWHNHPMVKLLAVSADNGLTEHNAMLQMKDMLKIMNKHRADRDQPNPKNSDCTDKTARMTSAGYPWSLRENRVLELAKNSTRVRDIVRRICMLYAADYRCLPVEIPEACSDMQLDADEPNIEVADDVDMEPEESECCKRVEEARLHSTTGADPKAEKQFTDFMDSRGKWIKFDVSLGACKVAKVDADAFHYVKDTTTYEFKLVDGIKIDETPLLASPGENIFVVPPLQLDLQKTSSTTQVVYIQDPIDRLLLAFERSEGLFRMGSKALSWADANVSFWKHNCIPSYENADEYQWKVQKWYPWNLPFAARFARLSGFVQDIETKGYFDRYVLPQTWLIKGSDQLNDANHVELKLGKGDVNYHPVPTKCKDQVQEFVDKYPDKNAGCNPSKGPCEAHKCKSMLREYYRWWFHCQLPHACGPNDTPTAMCSEIDVHNYCYNIGARKTPEAYAIFPEDLADPAAHNIPVREVARLLHRICMLYIADYACLPVELPSMYFEATVSNPCLLKPEFR